MRRALEVATSHAASAGPSSHPASAGPSSEPASAGPSPQLASAGPSSHPGDVPVGAIVLGPDGVELAAAGNEREALGDPTAHAEILALRRAAAVLGTRRLEGCTLVVTLEPCTMCAGALVLARVSTLVFGAWEPKTGAVGSLWDVVRDRRLNHRPEVYSGVLADECATLMREFFRLP
ncbi:deaminase [Actinoplanes sp. NBRC 103695]|uniref:nucleoside deaminase n=1 Tax=Actinoplanes sp. NBRC 103695 TaxID=3032202 RepID=UPI0025551511|nr:deaminase [Actinoplanes sp. NBRC 103695]